MKTRTIVALLSCLALIFCLYVTPSASAAASAEEEMLQILEKSFEAFNTSDGSLLSSVWWHSPKISMFGPEKSSPFLVQGWEEIDKGTKEMAKLPSGTFNFTLHHPQVTMLGDNAAFTTVYVTLVYTDPATKSQTVSQARQTLIFQKIDGKWLVVHNHSSIFPTE